jgi:hypothetical protein
LVGSLQAARAGRKRSFGDRRTAAERDLVAALALLQESKPLSSRKHGSASSALSEISGCTRLEKSSGMGALIFIRPAALFPRPAGFGFG